MIYETRINLRNKTKEELILYVNEGLETIRKYEAELEKKDRVINEIRKDIESNIYLAESNYDIEALNNYAKGMYDTYIDMRKRYFTNKVEKGGK